MGKHFVSLGMFIIDQFQFLAADGTETGQSQDPQVGTLFRSTPCIHLEIGGGGTYAAIGARIWLPAHEIGMIVDRGNDFPEDVQRQLDAYGSEMWHFRDNANRGTTRAVNIYRGEHRGFNYLTPRIRLTPVDLEDVPSLARPDTIHFICSPSRAADILAEADNIQGWTPTTLYEPIPDRCVPEELPALQKILSRIDILSPNAEEALSLLSIPLPPTPHTIQEAARRFLDMGIGPSSRGIVVIRCGAMGAFFEGHDTPGKWIPAFWDEATTGHVVDVTGAGNGFLGGLAAGLFLSRKIDEAILYATVSASFVVEQLGLPKVDTTDPNNNLWNGDSPRRRLEELRRRVGL
ncbi:Ribokinase-like protein [Sistotremastrum niveocremeum HHB9708]|uniref:Ribokinase-like protein n=1 Tax=Sistotremastrum niveocremeum HHB9708 TaxID=1314777 RepID=A0A164ZRX5_9AGAM|nr:Ribokinase-like protein [Sistotremastrum niveocremeum HHB9708]